GAVFHALLFEVQLAEMLVHPEFVDASRRRTEKRRNAPLAVETRETQAHYPERVFDQLVLGARQPQLIQLAAMIAADELAIQHLKERSERILQARLLEQRPAVHIERALVKIGRVS